MTVDPGAALRDWLNARDLRRWERRGRLPLTLDRTYWTAYEYARDLGRLQQHAYHVVDVQATQSYGDVTPMVTSLGPRRIRARGSRMPIRYRVIYERISYATWGAAVAGAAAGWHAAGE